MSIDAAVKEPQDRFHLNAMFDGNQKLYDFTPLFCRGSEQAYSGIIKEKLHT